MVFFGFTNINAMEKIPKNDYCELIDKTINLSELQQYYHVKSFPERIPLVIFANQFKGSFSKLKKFNASVMIVNSISNKAIEKSPYIKFNVVGQSTVEATFSYKPEGIKGNIRFVKNNSCWDGGKSKIVEM